MSGLSLDRREFLTGASALSAVTFAAPSALAAKKAKTTDPMIWAFYACFGVSNRRPLDFNQKLWERHIDYALKTGHNLMLVEVNAGLRYASHPELAQKDSQPASWMNAEVRRMRKRGLEVVPMLNFSWGHDLWLEKYRLLHASDKYFRVAKDLIVELGEIFEHPQFFHIGMDEETTGPKDHALVTFRKDDLWYAETARLCKICEEAGMRPWMWCDHGWDEEHVRYRQKCPKSAIQSNWHYDDWAVGFDLERLEKSPDWIDRYQANHIRLMVELNEAGFDQIPCGSTYMWDRRFRRGFEVNEAILDMARFCRERLDPKRLKGYLMAAWHEYQYPQEVEPLDFSMDLMKRLREQQTAGG